MNERGATDGDLNERMANLVEPRPPKPEGEHAAELGRLYLGWPGAVEVPLSEGGAWTAVCVYDEGDEPRWAARDFSGDFDLAMMAFRRLAPSGALALRYEPVTGWSARLADIDADDDEEEEGIGRSAAEAVCRLLWSRHRRAARGRPRERRVPGSFKGQLTPREDFDDPLPDEVLEDFEGGREESRP